MSQVVEVVCDGCGRREPWVKSSRPKGWRKLLVTEPNGDQHHFDACGTSCASKCVDTTYEDEDYHDVALRAVG